MKLKIGMVVRKGPEFYMVDSGKTLGTLVLVPIVFDSARKTIEVTTEAVENELKPY